MSTPWPARPAWSAQEARGRLVVGSGLVGCAVVVLLTLTQSLLWLALPLLLLLAYAAVAHPFGTACALGFLAAALPKAGFRVGDFPVPVLLPGLLLAAFLLHVRFRAGARPRGVVVAVGLLTAWVVLRAGVHLDEGPDQVFAFVAWAFLPLLVVFWCADLGVPPAFRRSVEAGFLLSVGYGVLQLALGIDAVAVPGVTYALGDDLDAKFNDIYVGSVVEFSKIPSTYQNGNIYGVVATVFLVLTLHRVLARGWRAYDAVLVGAAVLAVALSGSRSAVLAAAVAVPLLYLSRGRASTKIGFAAVATGSIGVALLVQPGLVRRFSVETLTSSGGSGRVDTWSDYLGSLGWQQLLLGSRDRVIPEGWPALVNELGLVGLALLVVAYATLLRRRADFRVVLLALAAAAVVDSTFLLFPTWFLPAILTAAPTPVASREPERPQPRPVRLTTPA